MHKKLFFIFIPLIFLALFATPNLAHASAAAGTSSLVGYWKFDEGSGTTVTDSSGYGNTGTYHGTTTSTDVPSSITFPDSASRSFNGTSDYVDLGSTPIIPASGAFSVSIWSKITSVTDYQSLFRFYNTNGEFILSLGKNGNTTLAGYPAYFAFRGHQSTVSNSSSLYIDNLLNKWSHIVLVYNGGSITSQSSYAIYLNGVSRSLTQFSNTAGGSSNANVIGNDNNGSLGVFTGLHDDVRIYNRALSATEVAELAAGGHTTSTFNGTTSGNYETSTNWSTGAVPDPYTDITVSSSSTNPLTFTTDEQTGSITVQSGATMDLAGYNLTQNDGGTFTNSGTLKVKNTETLTNFTNDASNGGTTEYDGTSTYTGLNAGNNYANLIFNGGSSSTYTIDHDLTVNGTLTVSAGSLQAAGYTTTLTGTGTVLNITSPSNQSFGTLTTTKAPATLIFPAGQTTTFPNAQSLNTLGNGYQGNVTMESSTSGTQATLSIPSGTVSLNYLTLQDINATGGATFYAGDNSTDAGNTTGWTFASPAGGGGGPAPATGNTQPTNPNTQTTPNSQAPNPQTPTPTSPPPPNTSSQLPDTSSGGELTQSQIDYFEQLILQIAQEIQALLRQRGLI